MKTLRITEAYRDGVTTVIMVEAVEMIRHQAPTGCVLSASLRPVAVVTHSAGGTAVTAVGDEAVDLEELRRTLPEIDALLRKDSGGDD